VTRVKRCRVDSKIGMSVAKFRTVRWNQPVPFRVSRLSPKLALLPSLLQLSVTLGVDLRPSPCEHVVRRQVANALCRRT